MFSFLGPSLLAVTPTFGEADVMQLNKNFSLKLAIIFS